MKFMVPDLQKNVFLHHVLSVVICAVVLALILLPQNADAQAVNIKDMQELVQRWMVIEKQETALVTNWQSQEQILLQRLQILEEEKQQLTQILSTSTNDNDQVTQRRLALLALQNTMEADQIEMQNTLDVAMGAINSLHAQLPPPIKEAWQIRLDNLTNEVENSTTNTSNIQLQALLEMLNQLQDFKQRISINENTIVLSDGSEILVKQLYLGLSHAWFVSADGQFSGYGQSQPNGWIWLEQPVVDANTVQQAIDMLERNVDVQLIELPIVLQTPPGGLKTQLATMEIQ